jgi:hypothetical protein
MSVFDYDARTLGHELRSLRAALSSRAASEFARMELPRRDYLHHQLI